MVWNRGGPMAWICVQCNATLSMSSANLICDRCCLTFPIVGEVPVLMAHPNLYLRKTRFNLITAGLNLMALRRKLLHENADEPRTVRASLKLEARERNQLLIEQLCLSSMKNISLQKNGPATSLIQPAIGWSAEDLIPYFCVDWTESSAYHDIRGHILSVIAGRRNFGQAAILGSGAGRLLADLADHFDSATGIDLSLPALILSRHLLTGGQLELSLERANWRAVTLIGSHRPPSNVRLAAADAAALPFANKSLSFVATQYLLDLVPNPARIAQEINRVLESEGTWFNFGLPFHLMSDTPELGRWEASDMVIFLSKFGFQPTVIREETLRHLDMTKLDATVIGETHNIVLFTARKVAELASDTARSALREYFGVKDNFVRRLKPRIRRGETLSISLIRSIREDGETSVEEIRLGNRGRRIEIEPLSRNIIEQIWRSLDGKHTVGEIIDLNRASFGKDLKEEDTLFILQKLNDTGVIELILYQIPKRPTLFRFPKAAGI